MRKLHLGIQWQSVRLAVGISLGVVIMTTLPMFLYYQLDPMILLSTRWFGIPFFVFYSLLVLPLVYQQGTCLAISIRSGWISLWSRF